MSIAPAGFWLSEHLKASPKVDCGLVDAPSEMCEAARHDVAEEVDLFHVRYFAIAFFKTSYRRLFAVFCLCKLGRGKVIFSWKA
jgi:hypothetical protein